MCEKNSQLSEPFFIFNAGIVLTNPFLPTLFQKCGYTKGNNFIDDNCRKKAVLLLEYVSTGNTGADDIQIMFCKLLCGTDLSEPVKDKAAISDEDKELVESMLKSMTENWKSLNQTTTEGLRSSFFIREGRLEEKEDRFYLKVEHKAYDVLLNSLPWSYINIKFPWMDKPLYTDWMY